MRSGSFAYLPTGAKWTFRNDSSAPIRFHWVRKVFKAVEGLDPPPTVFTLEDECVLDWMPDTEETWGTTRFFDPNDVRHDFHLNIVTSNRVPASPSWRPTSWSTGSTWWKAKPSID
ncbi:Hypothetical protein NGAL_HAMBI490_50090 [Neorhizobium galegae bv. officinalis]|nr:Hypothetical protein NGAL_HAMBI490_50090 [Neorhizobium galegae bv. officinalis]